MNEQIPNTPETSSEILEDVLKQLDKLGSDKRKQILNKLAASNLITDPDLKNQVQEFAASQKSTGAKGKSTASITTTTEPIQDEVEILDLHEPKLGTYKRKRSKSLQWIRITRSTITMRNRFFFF